MAALTANAELVGAMLGLVTLSSSWQEIAITMVNRTAGTIQLIADDTTPTTSSGPFLFAEADGAPNGADRTPAGGAAKLPITVAQSWWVKEDPDNPGATLRVSCAG